MGLKLSNVKKNYIDKVAVNNVSFEMDKPRCIRITSEPMGQEKQQQ